MFVLISPERRRVTHDIGIPSISPHSNPITNVIGYVGHGIGSPLISPTPNPITDAHGGGAKTCINYVPSGFVHRIVDNLGELHEL